MIIAISSCFAPKAELNGSLTHIPISEQHQTPSTFKLFFGHDGVLSSSLMHAAGVVARSLRQVITKPQPSPLFSSNCLFERRLCRQPVQCVGAEGVCRFRSMTLIEQQRQPIPSQPPKPVVDVRASQRQLISLIKSRWSSGIDCHAIRLLTPSYQPDLTSKQGLRANSSPPEWVRSESSLSGVLAGELHQVRRLRNVF